MAPSRIFDWFARKLGKPTPAQLAAWPLILGGKNVLIASPTGTGKTFAAFLGVLDGLLELHEKGALREAIYCIYISPLRALGYDLEKNLQEPLRELFGENPPLRVELRSGDTASHQRQRQWAKPPHILLTTPESLCLLLSQERWLARLSSARWLIIDEIHALADNKRGVHLSLSVERLEEMIATREDGAAGGLQRIGLSATIAPLAEVARFLTGERRPCEIVDVSTKKRLELRVHTPLRKNPYPEAGYSGQRLIRELGTLIKKHKTTLIFCNVRSGAEAVTYWLRENLPELAAEIECHHGSLERDVRREVEDRLKRGELRAVICSTSLELGIDIGSVELVVMMSTPKGVSKALQRAGRAGHNIHSISRGVLMATNVSDLVECCATVLLARARHLEEVRIPQAPLDVLAQHLVSMGCTRRWSRAAAFELVRGASPFAQLCQSDFDAVLEYLAGGGQSLKRQYSELFGKIELDEEGFQTRPGRVQREFLQNIGVIPTVASIRVRLRNKALGTLEETFVRQLRVGDVFMMSGRPVRLDRVSQLEAWVTSADGELPTVPRWNASKMPLSNRVADEIVAFRSELRARLEAALAFPLPAVSSPLSKEHPNRVPRIKPFEQVVPPDFILHPSSFILSKECESSLVEWIAQRLDCGLANAGIIFKMHLVQHQISEIPTADCLLIEQLAEPASKSQHYFFHSLIGRAANDALARVLTGRLSKLRGGNALATAHDYGFVLTVSASQCFTEADLPTLLNPRGFAGELEATLARSEMLKYHFRNAAQTGLMVYRNFFDQQKPVRKMAWSTEVIFNVLQQHEPDHVLLREARRDTLGSMVDCEGACRFLEAQASRPVRLRKLVRVPPLSFAMYATKIKEALLVEDPYETMERLYHQWWSEIEHGPHPPGV